MGAALAAAAAATTPAAAQIYHPGQVCWPETPCPDAASAAPTAATPPVARLGTHRKRRAGGRRAAVATHVAPSAPRFYRYPTIYSAEAPPLLPPGARNFPPYAQQPYVLVSHGVWYWPGANDFKMPQVSGFEPVIDPSRVLSW